MKQYRIKEYPKDNFVVQSKGWFGWSRIIQYNFRGEPILVTYYSLKQAQESLDLHIRRKNFKPKYVY